MNNELYQTFPKLELEYRLYYDVQGRPITMSSHAHPEGNYIIITQDQYNKPNYNCRVVNSKLQFDTGNSFRVQLQKSTTGVVVVQGYASLVAEESYPDIEYYDRIN